MNKEQILCNHCFFPFDKHFWHIPLNSLGTRLHGTFCSPECMLGYNKYHCEPFFEPQERDQRLEFIKARYATYFRRPISPAPPNAAKMNRDAWLSQLRRNDKKEVLEWEILLTFEIEKKRK